ncbi:TPA: ATP-dependent endonuclease [Candidatus Gastranaerophilales bacterium HUM_6]|nr:sMC domain protein [Fusobacterium sp. CAG:815]DAA93153.1 MAG TPA: ATP-dependent endonuclease [Candidatus Gastranaerophilales bacterium HUM_6]DAA93581.1 MAG TPA: ATP-dependent endonuclease [Candidatus Gastranaerophilales bacterium HUM_7]DAB01895.1 MAG TPA: ATP-dependent endonuclease [Candidatus Gastranaerophilales bacterium HUM_12]DAB06496.1 MAG TPA: ATP-dependent endonuclease [Candidatus Gastranaerophilales bacterium HUM_14]
MKNSKVKPLTKSQIIISIDRLTRFKNTETKYLRVFKDILTQNLIEPKFKKTDLEKMDYSELRNWAEFVINYSLEMAGLTLENDYLINQRLLNYENSVFENNKNVQELLNNKINYKACLSYIDEKSPKNLLWLKNLEISSDIRKSRFDNSLRFPVEKVVIAEGATEETLLPEFAKRCGYDFDKEGIYILSAGGKNQVVKLYYQLVESLKLPIFVLLDKDAKENLEEIQPKLRDIDKIHLLDCGEFEDLLPIKLVERTLDYELKNISMLEKEKLNEDIPRVKFLEEVFKTRGMHEFKKVEFAQMVKKNIKHEEDISPEVVEIIDEIRLSTKDRLENNRN